MLEPETARRTFEALTSDRVAPSSLLAVSPIGHVLFKFVGIAALLVEAGKAALLQHVTAARKPSARARSSSRKGVYSTADHDWPCMASLSEFEVLSRHFIASGHPGWARPFFRPDTRCLGFIVSVAATRSCSWRAGRDGGAPCSAGRNESAPRRARKGSNGPPYQSGFARCSSCAGSRIHSRQSMKLSGTPTASGGQRRATSMKVGYSILGSPS